VLDDVDIKDYDCAVAAEMRELSGLEIRLGGRGRWDSYPESAKVGVFL
jgi:hypothetical protein